MYAYMPITSDSQISYSSGVASGHKVVRAQPGPLTALIEYLTALIEYLTALIE